MLVAIALLAAATVAEAKAKARTTTRTTAKSATKSATRSTKTAKPKNPKAKQRSDAKYFTTPPDATSLPAYRYGELSPADCEAELVTRKIPFERETARGVLAPVRLTGPLHGVTFRTELSDQERETTPYEIADCRLVLALDDFAELLGRHDVVEVRHYSMYRMPPKSWAPDKIGTRHLGALAIDAAKFIHADGSKLVVDDDFHGAIDAKTCGDGAGPRPSTPAAEELRAILCESVDHRLFNVTLTPNYNKPHKNHFHLEITEGVKWFLVH
jgi:hypothetical protein